MWKVVVAGAVALGLSGCATTFHGVESVAAEVKQDEVAAAVKMRGSEVGLEGRVKNKGLKNEKVVTAKSNPLGLPMGFGGAEVVVKDKSVGYVELESRTAQPGHALCLFEPWALEGLAAVQKGQTVQLVCSFFTVDGEPADRFPVFRNCYVSD